MSQSLLVNHAQADHPAIVKKALDDLETHTYVQVCEKYGVSRGRVYRWALEHQRRKNEARIQEKQRERKARQQAFLQEVIDSATTSDVLDFLDGLPDGCVNLHATSIPYNIGKPYGEARGIDRKRHTYYLGWILQVLSEMERTLADGGVMFLQMGSTKDDRGRLRPLDSMLEGYLQEMGLSLQNRVIWPIPHGLTPKRRLSARYETALVLCKGDEPAHFNANAARVPQKQPDKRAFKGPRKGELSGHPLGAWPSDVWDDIGNVGANHPEKARGGGHPAQYPEKLVRRAVRLYTVPGELVCDPFDGSGTTTSVARQEQRSVIGCDLFYGDVRAKRLAAAADNPVSYIPLPGVTDQSIEVWKAEARPRAYVAPQASQGVQEVLFEFDTQQPEQKTA